MRKKDETGGDWEECLEVDIRVEEEVNDSQRSLAEQI